MAERSTEAGHVKLIVAGAVLVVVAAGLYLWSSHGSKKAAPEKLAGAHILIAYKGAKRAAASVTRSKAEAKELAARVAREARADPKSFTKLVEKYSDGPSAARGGDLGTWKPGAMVEAFDDAIIELQIGGVSGVVETEFGFHIILRNDPSAVPKL
jgi:parvulin-like peptidyl-prolyl isomerase